MKDLRSKDGVAVLHQFGANLIYLAAFGISILPTLLTRKIIFGGMFRFGAYTAYAVELASSVLAFRPVFFRSRNVDLDSSFGFRPPRSIPALSRAGSASKPISLLRPRPSTTSSHSYPYWDGMSSFGNRFFISLTPVFVFGLALLLERVGGLFRSLRLAYATAGPVCSGFLPCGIWRSSFSGARI